MSDNVYKKKKISLPCHKYMVRRIESETDKLEYARAFFTKLYEQGYDIHEILSGYVATAHFQEENHFDFLFYHDETLSGESFYYSVMEDSSIPSHKSCQLYARKYEKDIIPVCKICPCCSRYTNNKREEELSVLKKINASYNSLQLFLSESNASFFKCCADIVESTPAFTPLVVPLYRFCFNVIKSCGASYYEQDILNMSDSQRLSMLQNRMFAELKKKYEIDTRMPNYIHLFPLVYSSLVDEIERAADITDADMETFIALRHETKSKRQDSYTPLEKESICNKKAESSPKIDVDSLLLDGNKYLIKQFSNQENVSALEDTYHGDQSALHSPAAGIAPPVFSKTDNSHAYTDLATVLNEINYPNCKDNFINGLQTSQPVIELNTAEKYRTAHKEVDFSNNVETSETHDKSNVIFPKELRGAASILTGSIPLPCANKQQLSDNITVIDDKNIEFVAHAILEDVNLSLECVIDDHGDYAIVFWVRPLKQFYFSYFINMHDGIKELLSHKRIRKICYQPYYLYSLCKIHDIQIKQVYSFHSVHLHILNPDLNINYREVVKLYTRNKGFDHPISTLCELSEFMGGIPFYQTIHRVQSNLIAPNIKASSYLEDLENTDEVLGVSYLRALNFYDDTTLFTFEDGHLHFNRNINKNAKRAGFLLTYVIDDNNIDRKLKTKMYLSLLCDLSRTGRIRKMNLQLMTLYDDIMILFLGAAEYEFLTTYIFIHLYKIGQKYGCEHLNVTVSHERCILGCDM